MEPNLSSRKRNQSSSSSFNNPFEGIYTRSKSQIYLHHSRSGRSRSDVIRKRNHTQLYDAPPRRRYQPPSDQQEEESLQLENISHISIKDLRAHRVFSPSSMIGDEEDCFDNGGVSKFDYGCKIVNDISPSLCPISEDCCDKDVVVEESDEDFEKAMLVVEGLCDVNSKGNGGAVNLSGDFDQMKPLEVDEIGEIGSKNGGILSASVCKNDMDSSNVSVSRSKLVKVFKTPSSFNYRRLLPFLMDISKDDSCIQKIEIVDVGFPCKVQKLNHMSPNLSSVTVDDQCTSKKDDNGAHSDDRKTSENGGTEGRSMNGINPNSSQVEGTIELHNVEQRRNEVGENTVDMMEECYQMTPPDADIFSKPDEGDNTKDKEDKVLQNEDAVLDKPLNGSVSRNGGSNIGNGHPDCDQRKGFNSKSKLVLNPCSRMKVFKAPNSVSYRRLLPYLMDVAKENLCPSIISQGTKDEKDIDQMQHPVILPSSHLDAHMDKSVANSNSEEQHCTADEEPKLPTSTLTPLPTSALPMDDSSNEPNLTNGSSNLKGPNLVSSKNITQLQMPQDLQVEKSSELEHVLSESPSELEPETNNNVATNAASYTEALSGSNVNLENFPRECVLDVSQSASAECKGDPVQQMDNENEGTPMTGSLDQNSSQTEALTSSGIQVGGIRKGILRRNPRGCRGLCKCLNCASFHLHAERAFEFSRNQMQDAEEVASELMNELGYLRNILNETAVNPRVVQVHQVKEACSKALKAEELAKKRLGEMNEDLNFHCRNACLQQPRVTFSNNVEQKFIPKTGLTWK